MTIQQRFTKILSTMLIAGLCITPELASARQNTQPATPQSQATTSQPAATQAAPNQSSQDQQQQAPQQSRGTNIDPAQGPLQPVTSYPDASQQQQQNGPQNATETPETPQTTTTTTTTEAAPDAPQPRKPQEPVGAANAEKVPTAGGAASKPAGVAIAPAKQHQTRSLLLKIGAIAAAGVAAGTVYALTRGTPSTPPTNGITATQK